MRIGLDMSTARIAHPASAISFFKDSARRSTIDQLTN